MDDHIKPEARVEADKFLSMALPTQVILSKELVAEPVVIDDVKITDMPSCEDEIDDKNNGVLEYKENLVSLADIDMAREAAGGSNFNRLCNICRTGHKIPKEAKNMVKQARVFDTDTSFTEMAEDNDDTGDLERDREAVKRVWGWRMSQMNPYRSALLREFYEFNLPYPIVSVEHRTGVNVYAVAWLENSLDITRFGIMGNGDLTFSKFYLWPENDESVNGMFYEHYDWYASDKYQVKNNIEREARLTFDRPKSKDALWRWAHEVAAIRRNIIFSTFTDFAQLHAVNQPRNFILEEAPVNVEKIMRSKTYPKTSERPLYVILSPRAIRKRMRIPEPEVIKDGVKVTPHERRGHFRVLRADRFKRAADGSYKKLWIDSTWVGASENVVDGRRYRVILDELKPLEIGTEAEDSDE